MAKHITMKKILPFFAIASLVILVLFAGCSEDDEKYLKADCESIEIGNDGGDYTIHVSCNDDWFIDCEVDWINPIGELGNEKGDCTIHISENDTYDDRNGVVYLSYSKGRIAIQVLQHGKEDIILSTDKLKCEWSGGQKTLTIKSNMDFRYDIPSDIDWVHISTSPITKGLSSSEFHVSVDENRNEESRKANITFSSGKIEKLLSVEQDGYVRLQSITFKEGYSLLIDDNNPYELVPVFFPENTSEKEIVWSSTDDGVLNVENGILEAVNNGECTITASGIDGVSASINVTVKIKLESIIPVSEDGYNKYEDNWGFGHKDKLNFEVEPGNAWLGDLVYTSSNPDIVDIEGEYLVASSSVAGSSHIEIADSYSGISTFVDINVDRCFFYAGNAGMWRTVYGLMIPLGGGIYSNNPNDKFEVVNATVVDKDNHLIAIAKYIGNPSNWVTFCTENINVSEMFGDENTYDFDYVFQKLSEFKFLIGYKYNGGSEIYWEYVDIDGGSNVKI